MGRFLGLLNVEVDTGATYEPRGISEKVKTKLNQPLDFIVLIVSANGESMWTRDEISYAHGRGIKVIPLVEDGANFSPGLFSDLEYIPYARGHIADAFIKLLEAIRFVESDKRKVE